MNVLPDNRRVLRNLWAGLCELLAPTLCVACDTPIGLCDAPFCDACGPLVDLLPRPERSAPHLAAARYGGPLADAIRQLKYKGRSEHALRLATLFEPQLAQIANRVDVVVCIPLSRARLLERGYNHGALLAAACARAHGLPFAPRMLARGAWASPQVGRTRVERADLAGTFSASRRAEGARVLVVDDVCTTFATLDEARRALTAAGAASVTSLVLAQTEAAVQ